MERWSFGYALLKRIIQLAMWLSHRRITVLGNENVPKRTPVIFAPNHQNALMDPLAVICTNHTQPVWLARADIFNLKATRPILRFFKIMPVYRIRDGKNHLGKNEEIFSKAIQILENKKALGLFPEAAHSGRRQMLPHKKAIPRIAFLAEEKHNFSLNLKIIPVGIDYSHYWHFNRSIVVNYGEPIEVDSYFETYQKSQFEATMQLRDSIAEKIDQLIVNIKSKEHYDNYELMLLMLTDKFEQKHPNDGNKPKNSFLRQQQLLKILEQKEAELPQQFEKLHDQLSNYQKQLAEFKLTDQTVEKAITLNSFSPRRYLLMALLYPLAALGFVLHVIPFALPRHFIQQKVKDETFLSTFQFVAGLICYFLYLLLFLLATWLIFSDVLLTTAALPLFFVIGKLAYSALENIRRNIQLLCLFKLKKKSNTIYTEIQDLRLNLTEKLQELVRDFY